MNLNSVTITGYLTRDPELKYIGDGKTALCEFGIALNRRYKTPSGEKKEEVTFVDCKAFGRQAGIINDHLGKGSLVGIIGRLEQDRWEDKEGHKRDKMRVVVREVEFGPRDSARSEVPARDDRVPEPPF